nr:Mitochondrial distribution morphology family 35 apoptosis [Hymenolepis microstoma]
MPEGKSTSPTREDLQSARLGSLAPECNNLKDEYEQCFFEFFPRFLCGEKFKVDPCATQLDAYRKCVRCQLESKMGVDLTKLDAQLMSPAEMAEKVARGAANTKS